MKISQIILQCVSPLTSQHLKITTTFGAVFSLRKQKVSRTKKTIVKRLEKNTTPEKSQWRNKVQTFWTSQCEMSKNRTSLFTSFIALHVCSSLEVFVTLPDDGNRLLILTDGTSTAFLLRQTFTSCASAPRCVRRSRQWLTFILAGRADYATRHTLRRVRVFESRWQRQRFT